MSSPWQQQPGGTLTFWGAQVDTVVLKKRPNEQQWIWRAQIMMHFWGRQGCWLAHHTGCGKCTAWCSKHSFLTAEYGLACLCHIQKPAGYCPGSRQGSRLTQSTPEKREGSNHVCRGVHRAEKGSASQEKWNPQIYNWRGLSSDVDSPGLVTEWCDSHSPGPGLPQELAEKGGWGNRSTTAPRGTFTGCCGWTLWHIFLDVLGQGELCSYQASITQFMVGQLRAEVGAGSREAACLREKLPSGRTTRIAWDAGVVGDAWQERKSHLNDTGDHNIPQPISGCSVCLEMAAESTSTIFSDFHVCCLYALR